jgi:RNA 2',3'-cyclic 3'-phosphodiesterase
MRAFVAVAVPDDVADVLAALDRPAFDGVRWTSRGQWHVTLRFLGELTRTSPVVERLEREVSQGAALEATLGPATGWFPGRRVLQVPVQGLDDLATRTRVALRGLGAAGDDRLPFNGHVTLARVRGPRPGPAGLAGTHVWASWTVRDVLLVASTLGPGGARYTEVASVALGGG